MIFGQINRLALEIVRIAVPDDEAQSSAARSLVQLRVWCGGQNLCLGHDDDGELDVLELPLIDIAAWLVDGWDARVFGTARPAALARFRADVNVAHRWELSESLALSLEEAESLYDWASWRSLEFAASDYLLPNIVFDRVDDDMRVSWSQRAGGHSFNPLVFSPARGSILLSAPDFTALCAMVIQTTYAWAAQEPDAADPRVARLWSFLQRDLTSAGRRAAQHWAPAAWVDQLVPIHELCRLGETGVGGAVSCLLRSSGSLLQLSELLELMSLLHASTGTINERRLADLTEGVSADIDPASPWVSGYRLARHVRARLEALGDCTPEGPVPVKRVLSSLGVDCLEVRLARPEVDGVSLMNDQKAALAIVNPQGRLARTKAGRRSTLAHELCHFAFDAQRFQAIGQAEHRSDPESATEKRANAFAAELLLPQAALLRLAAGPTVRRAQLIGLARQFGVGIELAVNQALNARLQVIA